MEELKKEVKEFTVPVELNWSYRVSIEQLKRDIEKLEKLGVENVDIELDEDYGGTFVRIEAKTTREETDEEFAERVDKAERRAAHKLIQDRFMYDQLKTQFERT